MKNTTASFCDCEEPEIDDFSGPYEFDCKFCGKALRPRIPSASYVPPKTPWYVVNVHTWGGGGLNLPIYLAVLYYVLFYPLFTLGIVIGKVNDWWEGLFDKR